MGWYLKKSFAIGPFRLNLSKSGLGASVGIKDLRFSTGPKGAQVNAGRGGLYYRESLNRRGPDAGTRPRTEREGSPAQDAPDEASQADVGASESATRAAATFFGWQFGHQLVRSIVRALRRGR